MNSLLFTLTLVALVSSGANTPAAPPSLAALLRDRMPKFDVVVVDSEIDLDKLVSKCFVVFSSCLRCFVALISFDLTFVVDRES